MEQSPLNKLKDRIFNKKGKTTELTDLLDMAREFNCLGEIIGRNFEVTDKNGNLLYNIKQKPIAIKQVNTLLKEFLVLKKIDFEREQMMFGGKKGIRLNPKKPRK